MRVLFAACWLFGLALASVPAYAGSAKITLDCGAVAPDVMTGNATVTLCEASTIPCTGQTAACSAVACDSSGATVNQSTTMSCAAPFNVSAASYSLAFTDYDGSGGIIAGAATNGTLIMGKKRSMGGGAGFAIGNDGISLEIQ